MYEIVQWRGGVKKGGGGEGRRIPFVSDRLQQYSQYSVHFEMVLLSATSQP